MALKSSGGGSQLSLHTSNSSKAKQAQRINQIRNRYNLTENKQKLSRDLKFGHTAYTYSESAQPRNAVLT